MGSELVAKAEWLGGRDRLKLPACPRLVLQHMALKALDPSMKGLGDNRYSKTTDNRPAQLFTQSQAAACDELGMAPRRFMQHMAVLKSKGLVEVIEAAGRGRSPTYRLHVAEQYDALKSRETETD